VNAVNPANPLITVGIGECQWSADPEAQLITYALGSCVAVAIHDPVARAGGLLHILLPDSRLDPDDAARNPFKFADTGVPELFHGAYRLGAKKRRLRVVLVGGANILDERETFAVGSKNLVAVRKILWKAGVFIAAEETGGSQSRTLRMELRTGEVFLRVPGEAERTLGLAAA